MDVLSLLKSDHDTMIRRRRKNSVQGKTGTVRADSSGAVPAFEGGRAVFYPALKAFNGDGRRLVAQATREHKDIDQLLTQISRMEPSDEGYVDRVQALMEDVEYHIDGEEGQIFQFAKENCPRQQLEQLATEVEDRKAALARLRAA